MRIGYACRLIIEGKLSVSQISFESGFNNLSNFNRTFKKHTGYTPTDYFGEFHKK
jgi:AraC-like DNA-binding protein